MCRGQRQAWRPGTRGRRDDGLASGKMVGEGQGKKEGGMFNVKRGEGLAGDGCFISPVRFIKHFIEYLF
jgi:hypothetical protein